jgi:hypothetical protein
MRIQFVYDARAEAENEIETYFHCAKCIGEFKAGKARGQSPASYARTQTGITSDGMLQVWCARHDLNVAKINVRAEEGGRL